MKKIMFLFCMCVTTLIYSQEFEKGKEIFVANCAGCHNMEKKVVGPALENTIEAQGREWTSKWIVNNVELRASGDAHANEIYNEYNQQAMPGFEYLKSEDLNALLDYMEGFKKNKEEKVSSVPSSSPTEGGSTGGSIPTYLWIIIVVVLAILLLAAITIVTSLKLLNSYFAKITITNSQLIKKMNLDSKQVDDNVEKIFEKEVEKRVKDKVKTLRDSIDDNLKNFK